jgi:hypothetical protein
MNFKIVFILVAIKKISFVHLYDLLFLINIFN